mmetsp:Transcript_60546/g.132525  ORF Transcript_60546/g.132525 Transcript_60546/m.132525 type:complete len:230 (+) Transcript_60546:354-1043(+)
MQSLTIQDETNRQRLQNFSARTGTSTTLGGLHDVTSVLLALAQLRQVGDLRLGLHLVGRRPRRELKNPLRSVAGQRLRLRLRLLQLLLGRRLLLLLLLLLLLDLPQQLLRRLLVVEVGEASLALLLQGSVHCELEADLLPVDENAGAVALVHVHRHRAEGMEDVLLQALDLGGYHFDSFHSLRKSPDAPCHAIQDAVRDLGRVEIHEREAQVLGCLAVPRNRNEVQVIA